VSLAAAWPASARYLALQETGPFILAGVMGEISGASREPGKLEAGAPPETSSEGDVGHG